MSMLRHAKLDTTRSWYTGNRALTALYLFILQPAEADEQLLQDPGWILKRAQSIGETGRGSNQEGEASPRQKWWRRQRGAGSAISRPQQNRFYKFASKSTRLVHLGGMHLLWQVNSSNLAHGLLWELQQGHVVQQAVPHMSFQRWSLSMRLLILEVKWDMVGTTGIEVINCDCVGPHLQLMICW